MQIVGGPFRASLITFLILFSILGAANQNMLTSPRVYFAMARDGMFFKKIAECHPKFLTPHVSIVAITVWSILLTLTGTFKQLFTYVIFGEWIFFGLTVAAVIVLRKKRPDLERPYKTWGYPVTPILFVLAARLRRRGLAPQLLPERHVRAAASSAWASRPTCTGRASSDKSPGRTA